MASLSENERHQLELLFRLQDFRTMFDLIQNEYAHVGMGETLTDEERINEFKYITQQLRKYVSKQQDVILDHGADLEGMRAEVENLISKASEYGDTRKELIYNFMRDGWLIEVYNGISYLIDEREGQ